MNYANSYYGQAQPTFQTAPIQNDNFIWVHGEDGVYNYPLPRNYTAVIFDADNDGVFYIKTTNVDGNMTQRPRKFKFEEVQLAPPIVDGGVSIEDFNELKRQLEETKQMLEDLTSPSVSNKKEIRK